MGRTPAVWSPVKTSGLRHCTVVTFQRARSEEQREARRVAILGQAAAMLEEMRVNEVTLNELSRQVGLAKSNVLRYFESREAVLLELLDQRWKQWITDLIAELGTTGTSAITDRAVACFSMTLTDSLAARSTLCDLLSAQASVLEHNVSAQVAARYKRSSIDNSAALGLILASSFPQLGDRAGTLAGQVVMSIGAVWAHSRPSIGMRQAYEGDPALAGMRMDFRQALGDMLTTLITGTLGSRREGFGRHLGSERIG